MMNQEPENESESKTGLRKRNLVESAQQKIEQASKLLQRQIPYSGHFLAPKRLWLKRVDQGFCTTLVMSKLRQSPGLTVHVRHHTSTQSSAFYLTAPFSVLLKAAEEYHLPKALKEDKGGGLMEFFIQEFSSYEGSNDENIFFTTEERQWLVLRLLEGIRAKSSDKDVIPDLNLVEDQPIIPKCLIGGVISHVFPLHDPAALERLQNTWVRDVFARQPLDDITEYFGVKIGMYFAWLGHYTTALSIPALFGFIFWLCCNGKHQTLEDVGYVLFSIFNVVWVTTYLQAWKRYSAELAFRWGTLDQRDDLLAEPRPLFRGPLEVSPVTRRLEPHHPPWKRHVFRYCVTVPIIAVCLVAVFCIMIVSLQIQDYWDNILRNQGLPDWLGYLPKIMLAVIITLMDEAYFRIAIWLNDKVPVCKFIPVSILYCILSPRSSPVKRATCSTSNSSPAKMSFDMWGALSPLVAKPPPGNENSTDETSSNDTKEGGLDQPNAKRSMSQAELESTLYKYDGTFSDHLEMTIQLGYVILFSSAFPPAALCAMLNNLIEIRSDAFKLAYVCQRPFGQRVPNMVHGRMYGYMSIMAVLVNCALIGLSGQVHRMFSDMTATQTILLIVALEHIMLVIRFIITCAIPDIPGWLATEMAKIEWARREASRITNNTPSPEEMTSKLIGRFCVSPSHATVQSPENIKKSTEKLKHQESESTRENTPQATPTSPGVPSSTQSHFNHSHKSSGGIIINKIQEIPPFRPKKSKEWAAAESDTTHHLTIGPSGGMEWAKRLKEESEIHRSTDCIVPKDASSSDSDLLKSSPLWPPRPRSPPAHHIPARARPLIPIDPALSDSAKSISSQEADEATKAAEELAAKKTRVKQSLMKRARSVAIFSLKLKERRAREAQEKGMKPPVTPTALLPPPQQGGELGCIPIENFGYSTVVALGILENKSEVIV
ncbi:hypothetical protein JTB14_022876 [Gonioctena quinquepunctata]|nr:hypothetical protein JTB14_022876 [Gonioctena quinquepunctata]